MKKIDLSKILEAVNKSTVKVDFNMGELHFTVIENYFNQDGTPSIQEVRGLSVGENKKMVRVPQLRLLTSNSLNLSVLETELEKANANDDVDSKANSNLNCLGPND